MKSIEVAAEDYANSLEYNDYTIETEAAFKAGVEFAQQWININKESPQYYQTVLADNGKYIAVVARVSDGDEDFYLICGTNVYMSPDPIKWKFVTIK